MSNRQRRADLAAETLEIIETGRYQAPDGTDVSVGAELADAIAGTRLFTPDDLDQLLGVAPATTGDRSPGAHPSISVENTTTFAAARALLADDPTADVACLNFASAKNPGGGFLGGSQAQEEALARASGLYACLLQAPDYYEANRAERSLLYTDHLIHSPDVPVFRNDADELLAEPYTVSIITAPAPNAGAVRTNRPTEADLIEPTMRRRIDTVLAVARRRSHRRLVLGAWGCGVFRNDPRTVAELFRQALVDRPDPAFDRIVFAVLDHTANLDTYRPFREILVGS